MVVVVVVAVTDTVPKPPKMPTKPALANLWLAEFSHRGHCCICGNHGTIDTRGKVFTPAGYECGDLVYCICPNGRVMKKHDKDGSWLRQQKLKKN